MKWNEINLAKNEIISYEKAQEKEWNSLAKEWNSFHFTCLGISYHISSWQDIHECAGKCLGFIIKVVGTTPRPPLSLEDDESEGSEGRSKAWHWHLDILQSHLGCHSASDIYKKKINIKQRSRNEQTYVPLLYENLIAQREFNPRGAVWAAIGHDIL